MESLEDILRDLGEKPNMIIDSFFKIIGKSILFLCKISPLWSLDLIARIMENFAVFNYNRLAKLYPKYSELFEDMALAEKEHGDYFSRKKI